MEYTMKILPPVSTFDEEGKFTILQLSDLHLIFPWSSLHQKNCRLLDWMFEQCSPNMAVVSGDLALSLANRGVFSWFCAYMKRKGIPWSFCFGNHDTHLGVGKSALARELVQGGCLFPVSRPFDFVIPLQCGKDEPYALVFLDVADGGWLGGGKTPVSVDKLERTAAALRCLGNPPCTIFSHIPPTEECLRVAERLCAKGWFFGHDHLLDTACIKNGMLTGYCRCSGLAAHHTRGTAHGGRVIQLYHFGQSITSYLLKK